MSSQTFSEGTPHERSVVEVSVLDSLKFLARRGLRGQPQRVPGYINDQRMAVGRCASFVIQGIRPQRLRDIEFSVFSQWGEDGIIQHLIRSVPIDREAFIEIGVEDYSECNTRFLLCNDNWEGLLIDAGRSHLETITSEGLRWRYRVDGVSAWVTRENVNRIIAGAGMSGDIGLLSLDIDGNDYWVLDALSVVSPRIIVAEYNSVLGADQAITVPYRADFDRRAAHFSWLYYGASLAALDFAAERKGYRLVGTNGAGSNAFWVREDVAGNLPDLSPEKAYLPTKVRESRDPSGALSYMDPFQEGLRSMANLPVWDVRREQMTTLREIMGLPDPESPS